ncbi:hypothetical protein HXX76_007622 [Chlamydomonas incerta]|uniref:Protein kinase domain-containing protein n=1 Tax=Chlamydomonas incerta TaxID=51695 RepID=A0A835T0B0_CHLIN|nr:hypothetical protein HXX76_007622 [Chlamydomonas incerta]|eukprot:KAG2434732.1 hypothetical protein HXX76_007622 [Chlamydomonas incerta]
MYEVEADKARQDAAQQAAAADSSGSDGGNTATIVVAVVVPVGTVLLAALVGSAWWVRRSRRRELEQLQRAKAAAKAADIEAGGSQEKTGSGGARLGLMAGGVKSSGGGVFMGVDGEKDLPLWSEAAHHEADNVGDKTELHTTTPELTGHGRLRGSVSGSSSSGTEAGACPSNSSGPGSAVAQPRPAALIAPRMKPIIARLPQDASLFVVSAGQAERAQAHHGTAGATVDIVLKQHAPSPDEVVAELGALVKELRGNVNHVAIVLEGVLGQGSFGTVYKGTWQGLPVAIKTVVFTANQESRRHALKEAALCQSIGHPNVIATYASELQPIGVLPSATTSERLSAADDTTPESAQPSHLNITDWRLYIIQEFADGGPLSSLYGHRALWLSPGVVNLAAVVPLALGIARALEHLHSKRIVHSDLNPNNVLLKRDPAEPSGYAVKVGDFGLSVLLPTDRTHLSNIRMGTMFYICPEVACAGHIGPAADMFSLGVILWELYHGRRAGVRTQEGPRYCSNFPAYPASCPEVYKTTTLQCLQRQPHNRPDAATVAGALEQLLLGHLGAAQSAWLAAAAAP